MIGHSAASWDVVKVRLSGAPPPLNALLLAGAVAFLATAVLIVFTEGRALRVALVALGVSAVLTGLTLFANLNGAADFAARLEAERLEGTASRARVIRRTRVAAVLLLAVGLCFTVNGATGPL